MSVIEKPSKILGYERADGSFGIRNHVAIIPTVCCTNEVAKKISDQVEGTVAIPHECGCEVTSQLEIPTRTLIGVGRHPNVAAVLLISLGCETMDCEYVANEIGKSKKPVKVIVTQESGGTIKTTEKGVRIAQKMLQDAFQLEKKLNDEKMKDNMDINAGTIIEEEGHRIFDEILKVASGKKTKEEILGHNEFAIFRDRGHAY